MILKNQVEWALHCCAVLANLPEGKYVPTKVLAELHGVPKEYLSKAMQGLSQAGIVESTLGPAGGYRLALAPQEITFLGIVEAVEGRRSTFACTEIRANNPCRPEGFCDDKPCAIARVMWAADEAWRSKLRGVTLAELVETVKDDVPQEILVKSYNWVMERS